MAARPPRDTLPQGLRGRPGGASRDLFERRFGSPTNRTFRSSGKPRTMRPPFERSAGPTPSPRCRQTSSLTSDTSTGSWVSTSTNRRECLGPLACRSRCRRQVILRQPFAPLFRVTVEGGMKLSVLCRILETVSLGLDIFGRVADLTVIDAIAVGAFGANAVLMHSISSVEVCLSSSLTVTAANAKVTFGFSGGARQRQDCDMVVGEKRRGVAGALLRPRNDGCGAHCHLQVHSPTKVGPRSALLLPSEFRVSPSMHDSNSVPLSIHFSQIHGDLVPLFNPRCLGAVGHPAQVLLLPAIALVSLLRTDCDDASKPDGKV